MSISQTLPAPLGGISQQPAELRRQDQVAEMVNWLPAVGYGLTRRPPSDHKARLTTMLPALAGVQSFEIARSSDERYTVVRLNGRLRAFDLMTGDEVNVVAPSGWDYLSDEAALRTLTVGDTTILVNTEKVVARGEVLAPAQAKEALLVIRQVDYSTAYRITVAGVTVQHITGDGGAPASRAALDTGVLANILVSLLAANADLAGTFLFSTYGSSIHIRRADGADFSCSVADGLADKGFRLVKGHVRDIIELPDRGPEGMIVKVIGAPESAKDDFWVRYEADKDDPQAPGFWRECPSPGSPVALDETTMPWALSFRGTLERALAHVNVLRKPNVLLGLPSVTNIGWTDNAVTGAAIAPTSTHQIRDHADGVHVALGAVVDGTVLTVRALFDIELSALAFGSIVTVTLAVNSGPSTPFTFGTNSKVYSPGMTSRDEFLEVSGAIPANAEAKLILSYSGGTSPSTEFRKATVTTHAPGVLVQRTSTRNIVLSKMSEYPMGSTITAVVAGIPYAYTVTGADSSAEDVALGLASLIDAAVNISAGATGATIAVNRSVGGPPSITASVTLAGTTLYDPDASMEPNAHVGHTLRNLSDGSSGVIVANSAHTILVSSLTGGVSNVFKNADEAAVVGTGNYFVFDTIPWKNRKAGALDIVPFPSFVGESIRDLALCQNRLAFTFGRSIVLSAAGDLFNFFRLTATQLLDDDVIDVVSAHPRLSHFHSAVLWNGGLHLFSAEGAHFLVSGEPALTPSTVRMDYLGTVPSSPAFRPLVLGDRLFVAGSAPSGTCLHEVRYNAQDLPLYINRTKHVPSLVPIEAVGIIGYAAAGLVLLHSRRGPRNRLYVFSYLTQGEDDVQAAWHFWEVAPGTILTLSEAEGVLSVISAHPDGLHLSTMTLLPEDPAAPAVDE